MRELAKAIKKRIDQINFELLWPGFHEFPFVLYNDEKAVIDGEEIPKPEMFYGNTVVLFEETLYAIWKIDESSADISLDILTSKIIHEMFHGFQREKLDPRFPNEKSALNYTYDCVNLSMKFLEGAKLQKLTKGYSEKIFHELLASLKYRKEHYPFEFQYETKIETIEGLAQFVELMALKQLDVNAYHKKIFNMTNYIETIDHYKTIRFLSYDFGTLLMLIIKENSLDFHYDLACEKTIVDQLLELPTSDESKPYCKLEFKELIQEIYATRNTIIKSILDNPHETKDLHHTLYGFDPLNTFQHEQYIYCKDFAGIKSNELTWLRGEMLFEINEDGELIKLYSKKSAI